MRRAYAAATKASHHHHQQQYCLHHVARSTYNSASRRENRSIVGRDGLRAFTSNSTWPKNYGVDIRHASAIRPAEAAEGLTTERRTTLQSDERNGIGEVGGDEATLIESMRFPNEHSPYMEEEASRYGIGRTRVDTDWNLDRAGFWHSSHDLLNVDHRSALPSAVKHGDGDLVAQCLIVAARKRDFDFIRAISDDVFSSILRMISPSHFVKQTMTLHRQISFGLRKQLGIAPVNEIAYEYSALLTHIAAVRRMAGSRLQSEDYKTLLQSACDLGNAKLARVIWDAFRKDGWIADNGCYNALMAAHVQNGSHRPSTRHRVRTVPWNMTGRREQYRRTKFANYRIGGEDGILSMVKNIFDEMVRQGVSPDEESFVNLIIAAAREGRMGTVKAIMRNVWAIGIDEPDATKRAAHCTEDSPLRPTPRLLHAIAHAYGVNHDVPAALRLIDQIARRYQLSVSLDTWRELLERTFVLSIPRSGTSKRDGSRTGEMPARSVLELWNVMTGPPYLVSPTMDMYNFLIKNLALRAQTPLMVAKISDGIELSRRHRLEAESAWRDLTRAVQERIDRAAATASIESLRQRWEYLNLLCRRNTWWVRRWMALLLQSFDEWHTCDWVSQHHARGLPALLWEWRQWAPTRVLYETPTALVEFEIRTREEMDANARRKLQRLELQQSVLSQTTRHVSQTWFSDRRMTGANLRSRQERYADAAAFAEEDETT